MSTQVVVNTYAHSVTYVTDKMLTSLKSIIRWIGLDPSKFVDDWGSTETAVKTWLGSRDLVGMMLEIFNPTTGKLVTRWDFAIDYSYSTNGEGNMWVDTDAIRHAILKCGVIPSSCNYRVLIQTKPGRPDVPGWGPTTLRSTDGFIMQAIGTTIGTQSMGAQTIYWRKKQ